MQRLEDMGKFKTVVIDPPWPADASHFTLPAAGRNVQRYYPMPYDTMSLEEIGQIDIASILDRDALVFCWTTTRFLPLSFQVLKDWGLRYRFTMVWHKTKGPQLLNTPKYNAEYVVVGATGNPRFLDTKAFRMVNLWECGMTNSKKPEQFYDLLRRVTPSPRLDIFGRRRIAGFHSWGNEAPEGEPEGDHYQQVLVEEYDDFPDPDGWYYE